MARAVVTIKQTSSPSDAFRKLNDLGRDRGFLQDTKSIIESVHYSFGASDLFVCLCAPCWGDFATAVVRIAEYLDRGRRADSDFGAPGRTVTNTILGLGESGDGSPIESALDAATTLHRVLQENPDFSADKATLEVLGRHYLVELFDRAITVCSNLRELGVLGEIKQGDIKALTDLRNRLQLL